MRSRIEVFTVAALMTLAALGAAPALAEEVMYLPSWQGSASQINWGVIDYVMYAFAVPDGAGNFQVPAGLSTACSAAHSNGKKCLLSLGGWNDGNDSGFETLAASTGGRSTFATNCRNAINTYALDGVDLDWEYPEPEDTTNYAEMLRVLRSTIPAGQLVTAAVANHGYNARTPQDAVKRSSTNHLDWATIMSYDGDNGAGHAPYSYAVTAMDDWQSYGVPMNKTFLGVPFYGKPSWAGYSTLLAAGCSASSDTCVYQGVTNYYNGQPTIRQKRDLCLSRGCRGLMAWEVSFDVADSRSLQLAMNGGGSPTNTPTAAPTSRPTATPTAAPRATATPTTSTSGSCAGIPAWNGNGVSYTVGTNVTYNGRRYTCSVAHTSVYNWDPVSYAQGWGWGTPDYGLLCTSATASPTARPTATATATPGSTATPAPSSTPSSSCSGLPTFQSCTAYALGASVVFNNTKYTAIGTISSTRDCPPASPYDPATDNWWRNDGPCS